MAPIDQAEKKATVKKWNDAAERDLLMAMLCSNSTGSSIKANWSAVTNAMKGMGYDFTESAIVQKFQKGMTKDFRNRHGPDCIARFSSGGTANAPGELTTPRKPTSVGVGGSSSAKRKKVGGDAFTSINTPTKSRKETTAPAALDDGFDDLCHMDQTSMLSASKKLKIEADDSVDSPLTHPNHEPVGFEEWVKECET